MVRPFYSNRMEELLAELAARVRAQQLRDGPLVPVTIVVPSTAMDADVRLAIARVCGVAAHLELTLLTRFAADVVARTTGDRVADAASIQALVLAQLTDAEALAAPELAAVRAYLKVGDDGPAARDALDARAAQLSARIARIFEEYAYSRADLVEAWRTGRKALDADGEVEPWQRRLWNAIFSEGGLAARTGGPRIVPLCEAIGRLEPDALRGAMSGAGAVHVFAFPHFARAFHALLERVGRATDVVIYALSPCEGFWEDVDASDPEALLLWARPGREQVRALNALAGFDHDDRFVDPGDGTLLTALQRDVLHRRGTARNARAADESVVVLQHASARREIEAVASAVWQLCEDDEAVRFEDVAVVVPDGDAAEYAATIAAVFREAHGIPHRFVGVPGAPDRASEAVDLLLALPLGRFTRQEVLRVLVHPLVVAAVGAATGLDELDARRWATWTDALGIVHGADRSDHEGTYLTRDVFNWDQGLRRLALGAFMGGDATGDTRPFTADGHAYVPYEVAPADRADAAAFAWAARSLIEDARFARAAELTLPQWAAFFGALVDTYVAPTDRFEEERLVAIRRKLHAIGDTDAGGRPLRFRVACEIARERLARAGSSRGGDGVVVSTPAALRGMPFRFVFACGMGEGRFPTSDADDPLDLRWAGRREGDVTARERDRYAFLELLLAARDRLTLSYVSRDAVTGDVLAASSVVEELVGILRRVYGVSRASIARTHPLRRWDPVYFPDLFGTATALGTMHLPEARAEARTLAVRASAEAARVAVTLEEVAARATGDEAWAGLAAHLRMVPLPPLPPPPTGRIAIPLYAVAKFLEFPLQGWARFRLGLDELEDDDVMVREDEAFETSSRELTPLLKDVLLVSLNGAGPLERVYDEQMAGRELRGAGPTGTFARGERDRHLRTLDAWARELEAADAAAEGVLLHRFGRAGEHARADRVHDAITVDVDVVDAAGMLRPIRVEISGRCLPVGRAREEQVVLLRKPKLDPKGEKNAPWLRAERDRALVRAFVDHAALAASGVSVGRAREAVTAVATASGEGSSETVRFAPMTTDEATVWLRDVVRDLVQAPHAYFMPCEAAFARASEAPDGPLTPWLLQARSRLGDDDDRAALRSAYGPVPRTARYPLPDEATACAMVERRLGAFFARRLRAAADPEEEA